MIFCQKSYFLWRYLLAFLYLLPWQGRINIFPFSLGKLLFFVIKNSHKRILRTGSQNVHVPLVLYCKTFSKYTCSTGSPATNLHSSLSLPLPPFPIPRRRSLLPSFTPYLSLSKQPLHILFCLPPTKALSKLSADHLTPSFSKWDPAKKRFLFTASKQRTFLLMLTLPFLHPGRGRSPWQAPQSPPPKSILIYPFSPHSSHQTSVVFKLLSTSSSRAKRTMCPPLRFVDFLLSWGNLEGDVMWHLMYSYFAMYKSAWVSHVW